ncbi:MULTISPECIES: hypothetical protein [unclassified Microcoleus]|nr:MULTISPECIES: hypothetical protein [unclassified Microcoleus]
MVITHDGTAGDRTREHLSFAFVVHFKSSRAMYSTRASTAL